MSNTTDNYLEQLEEEKELELKYLAEHDCHLTPDDGCECLEIRSKYV